MDISTDNARNTLSDSSNQCEKLQDRFVGSMLGLAIGDSIGKQVEFRRPGTFPPVTGMKDGGTYRHLTAGQWTDDTSLCLCMAKSLVLKKGFNLIDHLHRYLAWRDFGYLSSSGHLFDIGGTTSNAISLFASSHKAICGSSQSLGNGSLMRLSPIPLYYSKYPLLAIQMAGLSGLTTHTSRDCIDSCRYMSSLILGALQGASKSQLCSPFYLPNGVPSDYWQLFPLCPSIREVAAGSFTVLNPPDIQGLGRVDKSIEAALWAFYHSTTFEDGVLNAVNLGDDSDTTAAIYGQLAGAYYGRSGIRSDWVALISQECVLTSNAREIFRSSQKLSSQWFTEVDVSGRVVVDVAGVKVVEVSNETGLIDDDVVRVVDNDETHQSIDSFIISLSEDLEQVWAGWKEKRIQPNYDGVRNQISNKANSILDDGPAGNLFVMACENLVVEFETRSPR